MKKPTYSITYYEDSCVVQAHYESRNFFFSDVPDVRTVYVSTYETEEEAKEAIDILEGFTPGQP